MFCALKIKSVRTNEMFCFHYPILPAVASKHIAAVRVGESRESHKQERTRKWTRKTGRDGTYFSPSISKTGTDGGVLKKLEQMMMMIAFITFKSSLVPLFEGL